MRLVAKEHEIIDPANHQSDLVSVQTELKLIVIREFLLILLVNIGAIVQQEFVIYGSSKVHKSEAYHDVSRIKVDNMCDYLHHPRLQCWHNISQELWLLLV